MSVRWRKTLTILTTVICLAFILSVSPSSGAEQEDILESRILKIGSDAPVFVTKNLEGGEFELKQHLGNKPIILFFWSFFCGPCREEMPVLQELYEDIGKENVVFVGVNLDGMKLSKAISKFMQDSNLDFTTIFDELSGLEYKIADPYGVAGTPTVYAIDLDGKISFSAVGRVEPEDLKEVINHSLSGS